jgi:hypothetical protein
MALAVFVAMPKPLVRERREEDEVLHYNGTVRRSLSSICITKTDAAAATLGC